MSKTGCPTVLPNLMRAENRFDFTIKCEKNSHNYNGAPNEPPALVECAAGF